MSETSKYVIQLEHQQPLVEGQENNLIYMVKDRALTERVNNLDSLLRLYNGFAGESENLEASGELSSSWINLETTQEGIYIVTDVSQETFETTSYTAEDNTTRHNGDWDNLSINDIDALAQIIIDTNVKQQLDAALAAQNQSSNSDDNEDDNTYDLSSYPFNISVTNTNYITNDETAARLSTGATCPAILIISKDTNHQTQAATLIDATGIIWKREQIDTDSYKWINLWDSKASISDFRQACAIIDLQNQAIAKLYDTLNNIATELKELQALKQLADILSASVDIDGTFDDVLVIGNNIDYEVNGNEYIVADVLKKFLRTNGDVVWLQTNSTLEALQYFYPVADSNGNTTYPSFIPGVNSSKVRFNQFATANKVYTIKDFEIVIILLNRNDLYSNDYSGSNFETRMGQYNSQSSVTTIRTNDAIVYYKNSELPDGVKEADDDSDSSYINYVPVTISPRTICDTILGLVKLIKQDTAQDGKSSAKIRIATPITWVLNNYTDMTNAQKNNMTKLTNEIKDKLCPTEGVPFISTDIIMNEAKEVELTDNGNARIKTTIDAYISQLCKSIEAGSSQQITYNLNTSPESMTSTLKNPNTVCTKTFTITPGVANKLGIRFSSSASISEVSACTLAETRDSTWASTQADITPAPTKRTEVGYRKNGGAQTAIGAFYATNGWKNNATYEIDCGPNDTIEFILHGYVTWEPTYTITLAAGGTKTIKATTTGGKATFYWKLEFYDASTPT